MKKKYLLIIPILLVLLLTGCKKTMTDAEKFAEEYKTMTEYNYYVYKDINEIIKILEHGTGAVYLGFPECPWCSAYVPMLNEVADINGLEKIYYYHIIRFTLIIARMVGVSYITIKRDRVMLDNKMRSN